MEEAVVELEDVQIDDAHDTDASLNDYEFTMAMLGRFIFSNMSVSKVKKDVAFDNLLERKTISSSTYLNFLKDIEKRYTVNLQYICSSCERVFINMPKRCTCGMKFKQGKGASLVSVSTCSITQQIIDVVEQNFNEITKPRALTEKRSQLNEFPNSLPEFRDGGRVIKLMINTDGVSPKQCYRGDMWPGYLAIADLNTEARGAVSNGIIAFLICGVGTPTEAMWKLALDPLKLELHELKTKGFIIKNTKFFVELVHGIFDNAASVHIYEGIGYNAIGKGCLNCLCESSQSELLTSKGKRSRRIIWPIEGEVEYRTDESILSDAEDGINGFKGGVTHWMGILLPNCWRLDALHVLEEGIIHRLLEPYFPKREWAEMSRVYFIDSLFPSRSKLHPRSILEYNKFNGGDKRCLYFTFFPLLLGYEVEEKPLETTVQFLLWHLIRLLASTLLTDKMIDDICEVLPTIAKYLDNIFPAELRQMKSHRFFLHLTHELKKFGTPYDYSTAYFEMLNRIIKVGFHPFDTTSLPVRALTMMLARKDWIAQVIKRGNKSDKFNKIVETICPSFTVRKIIFAKDDLVLYRLQEDICYGKILSAQNSSFTIQQITGISLMHYGNDDADLPGDIRYGFFLFNQHTPFGIKVTGYANSTTVMKQDIICHCCMFSDNHSSYIFSLDFRLSGK